MGEGGIARHYARPGLLEAIDKALRAAGKDPDHLGNADLAAIAHFHVRGREATESLAALLAPTANDIVLDAGCGLGGAARHLAETYGCRVVGIDLTPEYCRAAATLARRAGLGDRIATAAADATRLPFADGAFDIALTQHAAMNIADKDALYRELHRVVAPQGRLALYDVLQGPVGDVLFPVPWATAPAASHLLAPEALRQCLARAGFEITHWQDATASAREWFLKLDQPRASSKPPALDLRVLLGPDAPQMVRTLRRNLDETRAVIVEAVCRRR